MKQLGLILFAIQGLFAQTYLSPCDVNHDGVVNVVDVQAITNEVLGQSPCTADLNGDGKCDAVDAQRVITAALGGTCTTLPGPTTLRQAAAGRAILMGTAASADELPWVPNPLNEPAYAATLGAQYSMLSPGNALKWIPVHPAQSTYNFEPADQLVAYAQAHSMEIRGHNLCWYMSNPDWLNNLAKTASATTMSRVLQNHITTVMTRYRGQIFAWDVVNEAVSDWATGIGTDLQDSIWYNQPGIGLSGTGYVEQAFRWAHAADPNALLFYNDYAIEAPGPKFQAVYNMVKDFVSRGVPIHGVGLQMHIDTTGYPNTAGLTQNIQRLTALGLQVHITEMDVRLPVDTNGNASTADLQAQAQTYQRILTICLQNPGCTAFQTWGFTDRHSWIPDYFPGYGAALPFDANYHAKLSFDAMITALRTVAPALRGSAIVNGASYQAGAVSPGGRDVAYEWHPGEGGEFRSFNILNTIVAPLCYCPQGAQRRSTH